MLAAVSFLAAAPALLQALHPPSSRLLTRLRLLGRAPVPAGPAVLGGGTRSGDADHMPVTGHRPHAAGEHDDEACHPERDELDHDSGQQQPDAYQEPDSRLDDSALVVHPRVGSAHCVSEPRVIGIECLLDLLELALLVLRQRHGASHRTHAGTGSLTFTSRPGLCPEYERE